jgi:hypothetical protein
MGAILIGLLFGLAGIPVWLFILVLGWYLLRRFERKVVRLDEDPER